VARNALGRGLGALIREPEAPPVSPVQSLEPTSARLPGAAQLVDIDLIEPSPFQPRTRFREEALAELAQSIQANGIIQPLVLRPVGSRFQLLAGERRWRAAQRAGLTRVPAVLREVDDEAALEITLVENIQREDLNPVEEARAFQRLLDEFQLTQEEVATRTGKDRTTIANAVRLLRLEKAILDLIEDDRISPGHGRALLAITDPKLRISCAQRAGRGGLTVRQLERMATRRSRAPVAPAPPTIDPNTRAAVEQLQQALGTRVTLREPTRSRAGELVIEYYDSAQLAGIYERLMK
jgi:ParB family chromosome partitioning protein